MDQKGARVREPIREAAELLCARGRRPEQGRSQQLPRECVLSLSVCRIHTLLSRLLQISAQMLPQPETSASHPARNEPGILLVSCFPFALSCSSDHFQSFYHCLKVYFESTIQSVSSPPACELELVSRSGNVDPHIISHFIFLKHPHKS